MSKLTNKGFTLIELLVVVGIIAILAIAALIAINPLEAQRRTRDTARLQDLARLSGVVEAYINDQGSANLPAGAVNSVSAGVGTRSEPCDNNWISATADFCQYIKQIPADPQNGREINHIDGGGTEADPTRDDNTAGYGFVWSSAEGDYEFCTYLEADNSFGILAADGGNSVPWFETGSNAFDLNCDPSA